MLYIYSSSSCLIVSDGVPWKELIKEVGPTNPILTIPFENGITHSQICIPKTSKVIIVPSFSEGRLMSWVKREECLGKLDSFSRSNIRGII